MGLLNAIKENSRRVSDAVAGSADYYELATTNLSLLRALGPLYAEHVRGRVLDAGAGRQAYRALIEPHAERYESLDLDNADHVGDLLAIPLLDGAFDTVVCTQVIQHVPDPGLALREIARVLRPGGRLILSAPHLVWLHNEPHDYFRFTVHGLRRLIEEAGLRPLRIEPVGGLVCFLAYAPSTLLLAALWPVRPLFRLALLANRLFIRAALLADRFVGARRLYPTNYVVVAEKPDD